MAQVERATSSGGKQYLTRLLSNFQYVSGSNLDYLGFFWWSPSGGQAYNLTLDVQANIPVGFVVTSAKVTLFHSPIYWIDTSDFWGYSRNVRLYNTNNRKGFYQTQSASGLEFSFFTDETLTEITNAFGPSGFTAATPVGTTAVNEIVESIDITDEIQIGFNRFVIGTGDTLPAPAEAYAYYFARCGNAHATLDIIGYQG